MMDKIACIGCGLVGRAWAVCFARGGREVALHDESPGAVEAALQFADESLPRLAAEGLLDGADPGEVRARMRAAASLAEALDGVVHVQESTFEAIEVKRRVYAQLDGLEGRARCLVAHPINPPYLVPAVELVPAPWTDPAVLDRVATLMKEVGQAPIPLEREVDGFVVNRLQGALLQEAFRLVADGLADTESVDVAIRDGLGLRWSFMGPFETIDLNAPGGVRDYAERFEGMYAEMWKTQQHIVPWRGELIDRIEAERAARLPRGDLAERQAWRDRRLMALGAHKRRARDD
jgi:3-hydroxyacyl-CoA dehydrogenase